MRAILQTFSFLVFADPTFCMNSGNLSPQMEIEHPYHVLAFEGQEIFHIASLEQGQEQLHTAKDMLASEALWVEGADICRAVITSDLQGTPEAQDLLTQSWNLLGSFFEKRDETEKAFLCYNQALEIDPECFQAHKKKGFLFQKMKSFLDAIHCFEEALKQTEAPSSKAKILMTLGNIYAYPQIQDDQTALMYFENAWNLIEAMPPEQQLHVLNKRKVESYFFFCALVRHKNEASAALLAKVYEKNMQIFEPQSPLFQEMLSSAQTLSLQKLD